MQSKWDIEVDFLGKSPIIELAYMSATPLQIDFFVNKCHSLKEFMGFMFEIRAVVGAIKPLRHPDSFYSEKVERIPATNCPCCGGRIRRTQTAGLLAKSYFNVNYKRLKNDNRN